MVSGICPAPVIHGPDGVRWLQRYIDDGHYDGHEFLQYIGISRTAYWQSQPETFRFLERIFNLAERHKVLLHGFAITDIRLMFWFPFYSADSSSWIQATATGRVLIVRDGQLRRVHVSRHPECPASSYLDLQFAQEQIEAHGFDFSLMAYYAPAD